MIAPWPPVNGTFRGVLFEQGADEVDRRAGESPREMAVEPIGLLNELREVRPHHRADAVVAGEASRGELANCFGGKLDQLLREHHGSHAHGVVEDERVGPVGVIDRHVAGPKSRLAPLLNDEAVTLQQQGELVVLAGAARDQ